MKSISGIEWLSPADARAIEDAIINDPDNGPLERAIAELLRARAATGMTWEGLQSLVVHLLEMAEGAPTYKEDGVISTDDYRYVAQSVLEMTLEGLPVPSSPPSAVEHAFPDEGV